MSTVTINSAGELLKRLYAPWEIEDLVNTTYPTLEFCASKGSAALGGDGFRFAVRNQSAEGIGYIAEDGDLPAGGQTEVLQATVQPKVFAGVVQLSGLSRAVSSGDAMAFARTFDENTRHTIDSMAAYKEGAMYRSGSGLLATLTATPVAATNVTPVAVDDVGFFREGMKVDIKNGNNTVVQSAEVVAVDWAARTLLFDSDFQGSVVNTDTIYLSGTQPLTSVVTDREPGGFEDSMVTGGQYLGITRANAANWVASQITASSFLDEDILLRARTLITQESGVPISAMAGRFAAVTHPQQVDVLYKLAIPRVRYAGTSGIDLGNPDNLAFGGIPFKTSYQAPTDKVYMGDWMYHNSLYTPNGEMHIDTEYNGATLKWVSTKDVGLVFIKEYHNFALRKPTCFVRIDALTEPTR